MKITNIEVLLHFSVWRNLIFIRVDTDEGLTGVGEATIKNKELAVAETLQKYIIPYMIGQEPYTAVHLVNRFFTADSWRGGAVYLTAISGLEMALWDLVGKAAGQPVYNLFGGKCTNRLRAYANRWFDHAKTSEEYAQAAVDIIQKRGFTAIKWDPLKINPRYDRERLMVDSAIANVYDVRKAVGPDIDLCIELHGQLSRDGALAFARGVSQAKVRFIEEPMHPDDTDGFRLLADLSPVPVAAGERILSKYAYKEFLRRRSVSIVQMDITHMGGLLESKTAATMAENMGCLVAPHNSSGVVATMAAAMLDATMPHFLMQEMLVETLNSNDELMLEKMNFQDGYILLNDKPGLGIEPDWNKIRSVGYRSAFNERAR